MTRRLLALLAVLLAGAGTWSLARTAAATAPARAAAPARTPAAAQAVAAGRRLYLGSCSACHGQDARGLKGRGPSLYGAGALAADFYLRTGRMPLASPRDEPMRHRPLLQDGQIRDLVAYVATLGGPPVPAVRLGSVAHGHTLFADSCAGCHQIVGKGGIATGAVAPALQQATPVQVAEAIRIGPYLMPRFGPRQLTDRDVDDLAAYVTSTRHLQNPGGWAIGNLGPVPEGIVCWGLAMLLLLAVARGLGERAR